MIRMELNPEGMDCVSVRMHYTNRDEPLPYADQSYFGIEISETHRDKVEILLSAQQTAAVVNGVLHNLTKMELGLFDLEDEILANYIEMISTLMLDPGDEEVRLPKTLAAVKRVTERLAHDG